MKRELLIVGLAAALGAVAARELFPRVEHGLPPVPRIVTVHDTLHDTLRIRLPARTTTDTLQLVIRETIHDTTFVNVGPDTAARTRLWPVLAIEVGPKRGDTTVVNTFDLRSGRGATSRLYTPGPLLGVWADSMATPRLTFGAPPAPARVSLVTKAKWGAIGWGVCKLAEAVVR